jgi:hypothetical protein
MTKSFPKKSVLPKCSIIETKLIKYEIRSRIFSKVLKGLFQFSKTMTEK